MHVWGSTLYIMGADVHGPHWGIGHASGSAMLLVPDSNRDVFYLIKLEEGPELLLGTGGGPLSV